MLFGESLAALLDFADVTQNGCFLPDVFFFRDFAGINFLLKLKELFFQGGVVGPLLFGGAHKGAHDEFETGDGGEKDVVDQEHMNLSG